MLFIRRAFSQFETETYQMCNTRFRRDLCIRAPAVTGDLTHSLALSNARTKTDAAQHKQQLRSCTFISMLHQILAHHVTEPRENLAPHASCASRVFLLVSLQLGQRQLELSTEIENNSVPRNTCHSQLLLNKGTDHVALTMLP